MRAFTAAAVQVAPVPGALTKESIATHEKQKALSTMGRMPTAAAPTAAPKKAFSESGQSRTRSVPNSAASPPEAPYTPRWMSSPMMNTRASRRISSRMASQCRRPTPPRDACENGDAPPPSRCSVPLESLPHLLPRQAFCFGRERYQPCRGSALHPATTRMVKT